MVKFLIQRPIAILMTFLALIIFSVLALVRLPVSLLPDTEVPKMSIKVSYPNASPYEIEQNVLSVIRESFVTLNGLKSIESKAGYESGFVALNFEYNTPMDLAYIAANEKMDRLTERFPQDLNRPQIIKLNTTDIPVLRIQVAPKEGEDFVNISELVLNVIKKRLEQLEGVSVVDINGTRERVIRIAPDRVKLEALGLSEAVIISSIRQNNQELGGISVKDGQYRYYVRVQNILTDKSSVQQIPITLSSGEVLQLSALADIGYEENQNVGYHLFNDQDAIVIAVHKQAAARMNKLVPNVKEAVSLFQKDYPQIYFSITQDQSNLLTYSIDNLTTSLIAGGLFAFVILFLFMGNIRIPLIMGISLPASLLLSFLLFFAFNLSVNIISISGLALGLGMLIDNAIIVIDNITQKRSAGNSLMEACVNGVNEIMAPLISSVLTTLAVFVPLIFLGGISGALFLDQALSVTAILSVSLLVAFVLLPLLYRLFFKNKEVPKEDSRLFAGLKKGYKNLFQKTFSRKWLTILAIAIVVFTGFYFGGKLKVEGLPYTQKKEKLIILNWNEPVDIDESKARVQHFIRALGDKLQSAEADLGISQFLMQEVEGDIQRAELYLQFEGEERTLERDVSHYFSTNYPFADIEMRGAPNAFDQIFGREVVYVQAKFRNVNKERLIPTSFSKEIGIDQTYESGDGFVEESAIKISIDQEKASVYGVGYASLLERINVLFGNYLITELKSFGDAIPVYLKGEKLDIGSLLKLNTIKGLKNQSYPLDYFVSFDYVADFKYLTADNSGIYQSLEFETIDNITSLEAGLKDKAAQNNLLVSFTGRYYEDLDNIKELVLIFSISVMLLYFILVAQFESFLQPLIVIFTLPIGVAGSFILLWLTGTSLNVMSGIGVIIMLGIVVNDSILKIDTINRLIQQGMDMREAIGEAGAMRLKPILMTSLTTILALMPILFTSGIGTDLQRPLVYSVIGGLTIGTLAALFFVPIAYSWFGQKKLSSERLTN